MSRLSTPFALLTLFAAFPPPASARAEAGTLVENVSLKTLAGGSEKLLSVRAKANVVVFVRANQERSLDALKQMAVCEKELAGKPVNWVAIVSATEEPGEVKAMVSASGIRMPVLLDQNEMAKGLPFLSIDAEKAADQIWPGQLCTWCDTDCPV